MGRTYHGHITGKFWFGCQGSAPVKHFGGVEISQDICFASCGCSISSEELEGEKTYCSDCYSSFEEHLAEVREENGEEEESCYYECNTYEWMIHRDAFEEKCLPHINKHEELFNKYIETITFCEDFDLAYEIKWIDKKYESERLEEDRLIADLCFMKQIQEWFKRNEDENTCSWNSEY